MISPTQNFRLCWFSYFFHPFWVTGSPAVPLSGTLDRTSVVFGTDHRSRTVYFTLREDQNSWTSWDFVRKKHLFGPWKNVILGSGLCVDVFCFEFSNRTAEAALKKGMKQEEIDRIKIPSRTRGCGLNLGEAK